LLNKTHICSGKNGRHFSENKHIVGPSLWTT